ncbi:hypothetical protein C8Q72DRAFT_568324 [Fomitopsis betulina]|nr:hypothetical protein C8Q72DRAFT_568324 [Fomitopsis betulina]
MCLLPLVALRSLLPLAARFDSRIGIHAASCSRRLLLLWTTQSSLSRRVATATINRRYGDAPGQVPMVVSRNSQVRRPCWHSRYMGTGQLRPSCVSRDMWYVR